MDPSSLCLKIPGPLFSKLLHERYKEASNCGGLLYGQIVTQTKSEITDSQHLTKSEGLLYVEDYQPMTNRQFYSSTNPQLKNDAWSSVASRPKFSCVGHYRIRNAANKLSFLEKSMHKKLSRNEENTNNLVVTLLITHESSYGACLSWKINAYTLHESGEFSPIKIEISNLQGSVNDLYSTNTSPGNHSLSERTSGFLQSFQSSLTRNEEIHFLQSTRKVTQDLISELDGAFERLEEREKLLKEVLEEKYVLSAELNSLQDKKESLSKAVVQSKKRSEENAEIPTVSTGIQTRQVDTNSESSLYDIQENEHNYQAMKRRSLEDMERRSPVVMLKKINPDKLKNQTAAEPVVSQPQEVPSADPFANLVSSAKSELTKDVEMAASRVSENGLPCNSASSNTAFDVSPGKVPLNR